MNKAWFILPGAILGGLLLDYLSVPAGAMVGAMLTTAVLQAGSGRKFSVPVKVKGAVRVIMGCYIGLGLTAAGFAQVGKILGAALLVMAGMLVLPLLITLLVHKLFGWELAQAFLCSLPAGLSEVAMNSEEFKVNPVITTIIHLFRLISILVLVPIILKIL